MSKLPKWCVDDEPARCAQVILSHSLGGLRAATTWLDVFTLEDYEGWCRVGVTDCEISKRLVDGGWLFLGRPYPKPVVVDGDEFSLVYLEITHQGVELLDILIDRLYPSVKAGSE